ncbi:MAG: DUF448 domain-containing protein [Sphingomonadaceae bacterium]|nr:DUF448 domain-containing protein [Sphingomonadaceae bacterium]
MRAANNESALAPEISDDEGADRHTPVRTCILTRTQGTRDGLIRLALGPDGTVAPDLRARAPGRGAWIGVTKSELDAALAKGKLKGALNRAFKTQAVRVPADLPDRIAAQLERAFLDRLGLEARASTLVTGSDRIEQAARTGKVHLLLHAGDASDDGNRRLDQALRVGESGHRGLVLPLPRTILSMALGRENVVHIALTDQPAATRVASALARWLGFIGSDGGGTPCDAIARAPAADDVCEE